MRTRHLTNNVAGASVDRDLLERVVVVANRSDVAAVRRAKDLLDVLDDQVNSDVVVRAARN